MENKKEPYPVGRQPRGVAVMQGAHPNGTDLILVTNSGSNNITVLDKDGDPYAIVPTDPVDWKAGEEPVGIAIDDDSNIWVAGLRDYKVAKIVTTPPDIAVVVKRTTAGIWMGKPEWRPGPFAIGDMTGYVYNNFAGP